MRIGGRSSVVLVCVSALVVGACGGDDGREVARATVPVESSTSSSAVTTSSTTSSTVPAPVFEPLLADPGLSLEEQVEAAYLFYWEVVLDAFARGDGAALPLVLTGEALVLRMNELDALVADGYRFTGEVGHDHRITVMGPAEAVVVDVEHNRLQTVDAASGEAGGPPADEHVMFEYTLLLEDETWRVSEAVRYQPEP